MAAGHPEPGITTLAANIPGQHSESSQEQQTQLSQYQMF